MSMLVCSMACVSEFPASVVFMLIACSRTDCRSYGASELKAYTRALRSGAPTNAVTVAHIKCI